MTLERTSSNFDVNAILSLLGSNGGDASDAFEAQPSTAEAQPEYIYMTLGEKLQILREMEDNSAQYADQAISRGLISPNQRADFQNLISANVRLMEEQRGNINFDPATSANARLIDSASPNMSSALDQIIVDRYAASNDQTNSAPVNTIAAVDPVAEAFASDVEEMTDDIRFNPSSNLAEEAAQILNSPLAARLDSGVLMNLRAAVNLQEEKQENGGNAFANGEAWNERREQTERERKEQARVADIADDIQNAQQQEQQRQERAEAWRNEEHDYAGQRMTGAQWMQMIQWFRTPENRTEWEDAMMAETGQTRDQVRATGSRMDRYFDLMEKQANGGTLNQDEQSEFSTLDSDPAVRRGVSTMQDLQSNRLGVAVSAPTSGSANIEGGLRNGSLEASRADGTAIYDDGGSVRSSVTSIAPAPISVASTLDAQASADNRGALSTTFRVAASGNPVSEPTPPVSPSPIASPTRVASTAIDIGVANM